MIETPEELNLQTNLNSDWSFDCEYLYQKQFSIIVLSHLISEFRQRHDNFTLLEFKKTDKQMTAKPIVDYFQGVCDATIMHETLNPETQKILSNNICGPKIFEVF